MSNANSHVNVKMLVYVVGNGVFCAECGFACAVEHIDYKIRVKCENSQCYQYDRPGRFPRVELDGFDYQPPLREA